MRQGNRKQNEPARRGLSAPTYVFPRFLMPRYGTGTALLDALDSENPNALLLLLKPDDESSCGNRNSHSLQLARGSPLRYESFHSE